MFCAISLDKVSPHTRLNGEPTGHRVTASSYSLLSENFSIYARHPRPDGAPSDNTSIAEYSAELENEDFTVAAYTVALHTSSVNEWPSVVYNDVIIVAANVCSSTYPPQNATAEHLAAATRLPRGRQRQDTSSPHDSRQRCTEVDAITNPSPRHANHD